MCFTIQRFIWEGRVRLDELIWSFLTNYCRLRLISSSEKPWRVKVPECRSRRLFNQISKCHEFCIQSKMRHALSLFLLLKLQWHKITLFSLWNCDNWTKALMARTKCFMERPSEELTGRALAFSLAANTEKRRYSSTHWKTHERKLLLACVKI